jgi:anion-transporting  ArsA/GET3 family ATPase
VPARTPRQIHFVTGKGGVGKSLISCALARRFVAEGDRTLLVQVNARDSHAPLLRLPPVGDDIAEAGRHLWTLNLHPAQAMREYALMTLKLETLYKAVFENRLTRTFLRFVPSLAELTMMGKLWFHAEEQREGGGFFGGGDGGRPRFDRIVVDLPSTGHATRLLAVSRVLTEAVKVGPMADKTRQMASCFADPRRSAIHVVTLPEELPVNETLELLAVLQREKTVHVGHLIVNQVLPRVFDERTEAALRSLTLDGGLAPVLDAGRRRLGRERLEAREIARLLQGGRPLIEVPLLSESPLEVHHVDRVAGLLGEVP